MVDEAAERLRAMLAEDEAQQARCAAGIAACGECVVCVGP